MPSTTVKPKTEAERAREEALFQLANLGGRLTTEEDIVFQGRKFVLPETVDLDGAVDFLTQKAREDNEVMNFNREYMYRPLDGARATSNAIKRAFGFGIAKPIYTFFGKEPPQLIDVATSATETEQVPWGKMALPGLENTFVHVGGGKNAEYGPVFRLTVEAPRKFRFHIAGLFALVEDELQKNSIYRGKAIDGQESPKFIDLSGVDPSRVVYSQDTLRQLEANVWSPIVHAKKLAELGQSGKRAVLFEGPYGTGKTLAALLTAKLAVEHGCTFIMCRPGRDNFDMVMQTARIYQPSVVFFEDIDTLAAPGEADHVSRVLDTFDGLQSKGTRIIIVLTTNHAERIHKGMVRPGRLDAVIHIGAMDAPGVEYLTREIIGDALAADVDFDRVYKAVEGYMPAFVTEALGRAVRYSVSRNNGELGKIDTDDLVSAADGLRAQLALMNDAADVTHAATIDSTMKKLVAHQVGTTISESKVILDGQEWADLNWPLTPAGNGVH